MPIQVSYLEESYTNAVYSVLEFGNFGLLVFPRYSEMDVFSLAPNPEKAKSVFLAKKFKITVTQVSTNCSREDFVPALPGVALITDVRFADKSGAVLTYPVKTDRWPNENEIKTISAHTNIVRARNESFKGIIHNRTAPRFMILVICVGTTLAVLLMLLRKNKLTAKL